MLEPVVDHLFLHLGLLDPTVDHQDPALERVDVLGGQVGLTGQAHVHCEGVLFLLAAQGVVELEGVESLHGDVEVEESFLLVLLLGQDLPSRIDDFHDEVDVVLVPVVLQEERSSDVGWHLGHVFEELLLALRSHVGCHHVGRGEIMHVLVPFLH